jgi:hypothetical protein
MTTFCFDMSTGSEGTIAVNAGTLDWGPFSFDFTSDVPPGDSLASAVVPSKFASGGDSTSALITPESVTVTGSSVSLRVQYPGDAFAGSPGLHRLLFELTMTSGAKQEREFGNVRVTQY